MTQYNIRTIDYLRTVSAHEVLYLFAVFLDIKFQALRLQKESEVKHECTVQSYNLIMVIIYGNFNPRAIVTLKKKKQCVAIYGF